MQFFKKHLLLSVKKNEFFIGSQGTLLALFENINNYYFVLCGISGLLFHSLGLSLGSEMLACEISKPWFDLHRAGIMFRMSKKR